MHIVPHCEDIWIGIQHRKLTVYNLEDLTRFTPWLYGEILSSVTRDSDKRGSPSPQCYFTTHLNLCHNWQLCHISVPRCCFSVLFSCCCFLSAPPRTCVLRTACVVLTDPTTVLFRKCCLTTASTRTTNLATATRPVITWETAARITTHSVKQQVGFAVIFTVTQLQMRKYYWFYLHST